MATANDIDNYHQLLLAAINDESLLGQVAAIRSTPGIDWRNPKWQGIIHFDLWPTIAPMTAVSDQGRELAVFAMENVTVIGSGELEEIDGKANSSICWISWHESWERLVPDTIFPGKKAKPPHFMLGTIQWILFWGKPDDDRKVQIVRGEWDNAAHVSKMRREYQKEPEKGRRKREDGESDAGQPHWHVDRLLELGDIDAIDEYKGTELELFARQDYTGKYLHLQRVHLAMGGWKNEPPEHNQAADAAPDLTARWKISYTEDREELIDWNLSTLRYIKSQIRHIDKV